MATEASRSNGDGNGNGPTADSYIGSLISLISKSEIRYEGLLFNISTSESSIGLRNVKSFGTEGRKKDGPQVPPSDKVYEYILFRGNDIKDLQVKSSQPVESTSSLYQDPAIIESHYSQGAATSTSSHIQQVGLPKSTPQSSLPLYQPSTISGSWGFTPMPPITNSSSFPMPMYMQGFYGASEGIQTPQQSLLQSPSGLSIPPSMQQYPVTTASIPSNFSALPFSVSTGPLLPPFSTGTLNSNLMPSAQLSALLSDTSTTLTSNKALTQALPTAALSSGLPWASPPESVLDRSTFSSETVAGSLMSYDIGFKPQPSDAGSSSSFPSKGSTPLLVTPNQLLQPGPTANGLFRSGPTTNDFLQPGPTENGLLQPQPKPNQVLQTGSTPNPFLQPAVGNQNLQLEHTPSQLLQPGLATSQVFHPGSKSNQHLQPGITASSSNYTLESAQKDVEVVQLPSPRLPLTTSKENRGPILPLPSPHDYKVNGHPSYTRYNSRGGHDKFRGHGGLQQHVPRFTEEFDFTAMNEKFNKDEIWGDLGKGNTTGEEQGSPDEDHSTKSNLELKPVYVKDDFFDSISCNVSDRASKNGRTNFSELRKLDVETFGNFARHGGGHGYSNTGRGFGHGYNRGGRGYGNNNGRGYGGRGYGGGGNNGRGHSGYDRSYGYNGRGYGHHAT